MIDPGNLGTISGRLVADPEIKENTARFSIARDFAGYNSDDKSDKTGFFDFFIFLDDSDQNASFFKSQVQKGNMKKGSSVTVSYSLQHNRWTDQAGGGKRSTIRLRAHSVGYNGGVSKSDGQQSSSASSSGASSAPVTVPEF